MYGQAGHAHTPGMPMLDSLDATARHREREATKARKERAKTHVRTKHQRRDRRDK